MMRLKAILLVLLLVPFWNTTLNAAEPNKENSVRQFVMGMYKEVLPAAAIEQGDWYVGKYFSESLLDFYSLVDRHDKIYHEDEQGCFNLDLWTQSEVADVKYIPVIKSVKFEEDWQGEEYVVVEVILKSPNPSYYPDSNISLSLWETDEGWKIKDYNGIEMKMKSYLSGDHPCLENQIQ